MVRSPVQMKAAVLGTRLRLRPEAVQDICARWRKRNPECIEEEEVAWGGLAGDDAPVDTDPPRATPAIPPDEPPLDEAGPSEARGGNRPGMGNRLGFLTPFGCRFGLPIALPDGWNPRARLEAAFDRRRSGDRSAGPSSDTHSGSLGLD